MDILDYIKNNKICFISILINLVLIIILGIVGYKYFNYECICEQDIVEKNIISYECEDKKLDSFVDNDFYIEVKGAVNKPGVYKVKSNNIINDAISMAGGFTKNAYTNNINLSRKVTSELVIYIYTKDEYEKSNNNMFTVEQPCICNDYNISNCTEEHKSEIIPDKENNSSNNAEDKKDDNTNIGETSTNNSQNIKININTATKQELTTLIGIGESKADKIIDYRTKNGNFKSIEDLKKVSGIGEAVVEKIKDSITV